MKCLAIALIAIGLVIVSEASPAQRKKRFAGFGAFSTVGGRVGCVVSENAPGNASLFINSHFTKYLSEDEQQELDQYKQDLAKFKVDVKTFLEQRQKQALTARRPSTFPSRNAGGFGGNGAVEPLDASPDTSRAGPPQPTGASAAKQPEPPKKPSFCSEKATTQYVFDGCSVQGDNVYIGDNFVRKLSATEQDELAQFDKQFTAYQKAVTTNFKQQVEEIFGKHFGSLFEAGSSANSKSTEVGAASAPEPSSEGGSGSSSSTTAATPAEAPKTPNFCTLIV